jgi:hypothetical protein
MLFPAAAEAASNGEEQTQNRPKSEMGKTECEDSLAAHSRGECDRRNSH